MRRLLTWTILGLGATALTACSGVGSVGGQGGGGSGATSTGTDTTSSTGTGTVVQSKVDKVDLILGIDNSRSMADKQQILSLALGDLVNALTNPPCVDGTGTPSAAQPAGPVDDCPTAGTKRAYNPVLDIHIGVVTSSLGGHGSDACPNTESFSCPGGATNTTNNDMGHLVSRIDPCSGGSVSTYQNKGFLAWDPSAKDTPPGVADSGTLTTGINDLVLGAGQIGCGYESQMESWYRFLVDPNPYQSLTIDATGSVNPVGIDNALLQQRKDFLRPDSLLAILMLSDENDCSIKEYGQFYFAAQQRNPANPNTNFYLPKARAECATNPNDTCCRSCGQDQSGCPADPNCPGELDAQSDDVNLRCFDQKRRFGIDFLYPVDRYVNGLSSLTVPDRTGNLAPNPIFTNLDPTANGNAQIRDAGLVVLSGIVGVPWQDLARDPKDLTKGYKTAEELAHATSGVTTWDVILGDPANYVPPKDPHMIESTSPRTGTDPITGDMIAPPTSAPNADAINGHEYTPGTNMGVQVAPDDLEYACVFDLPTPRDCTDPSIVSCDCGDPKNDNPLCETNPTDSSKGRTTQVRAKGYPGIRQLNVLRDLGPQGVAASICPAQQNDPTRADYAYRPAVQALVTRVKSRLRGL